jgi:hypothetical protein
MISYPKNQLVPAIASDSVADLMVGLADTAIDAAIESGALDGIPVVGLTTGLMKATRDVRQAFMVRKLALFLGETANLTIEERVKFKNSFCAEEQAEEFGGLLVVLLERADDLAKPRILGRLLVAYARGVFTQEEFFRISRMVERSLLMISIYSMASRLAACRAGRFRRKTFRLLVFSIRPALTVMKMEVFSIRFRHMESGLCSMGLRANKPLAWAGPH